MLGPRHAAAQTPARRLCGGRRVQLRQVAYIKASNPAEEAICAEASYRHAGNSSGRQRTATRCGRRSAREQRGEGASTATGRQASATARAPCTSSSRSGGRRAEQAYVKASNPDAAPIRLSRRPERATATRWRSAPYEDSGATGVNGNQADDRSRRAPSTCFPGRGSDMVAAGLRQGVEHRAAATDSKAISSATPSRSATTATRSRSARSAKTAPRPASTATRTTIPRAAGAAYVFTRSGTTWSQQAYVKSSTARPECAVRLLGRIERERRHAGASREFDEDRGKGALFVFTRSGGAWSQQADIRAKERESGDSIGCWVAISDDGNTIAAGAPTKTAHPRHQRREERRRDRSAGRFVRRRLRVHAQRDDLDEQAYSKPPTPARTTGSASASRISGDGNTLAVGAPNEDSAAQGINGKQDDESATAPVASTSSPAPARAWKQQSYSRARTRRSSTSSAAARR